MTTNRTALLLAATLLALAAPLALSGCGVVGEQTGNRVGDTAGDHLVAYVAERGGNSDIGLYDLDAGGFRGLPNLNSTTAADLEPVISEDGYLLAFTSQRSSGLGSAGGTDICIYGRGSEALLDVPNLNTADNESAPRFAYDNIKLAFVRDSSGWKRVRLYDPRGDSLVSAPGITSVGAWHDDRPAPDLHGDRIAFVSDRSGASHVYVWNRSGGIAAPAGLVTDGLDAEPSLSSNGRWLAFASTRTGGAGGWDVFLYDLTNSTFVPLPRLNSAGDERFPAVNAAGTRVMFQARATAGDDWDLWSYTLSDSTSRQPTNLSSSTENDTQPYLRWR